MDNQIDSSLQQVFTDEAACKGRETCSRLAVRELFFEPNPATLPMWQARNSFYRDGIDRRVVFVCESPSEIRRGVPPDFAVGGVNGYRCWSGYNRKAVPFLDARVREGFEHCLITNTVKCGVPRPSTPSRLTDREMANCSSFLVRELNIIRPAIVVCVGQAAHSIFDRHTLAKLAFGPAVRQITHYSFRGTKAALSDRWQREFAAIKQELKRLGLPDDRPLFIGGGHYVPAS